MSLQQAYHKTTLSTSQRQALIRLIEKEIDTNGT